MHSADTDGFSRRRQARAADAQADGRPRALARINPESGHGEIRRPEPSYTVIRPQLDDDDSDRTVLRPRELLAPIAAAMKAANEAKARNASARPTPARMAPASARPMPPPIPTQAHAAQAQAAQAPAMSDFARVRATTTRGVAVGIGTPAGMRPMAPPMRAEKAPTSKKRSVFIAIAVCIVGASLGVAGAAALNEQLTGPSAGELPIAHRTERVETVMAAAPAAPAATPPAPAMPAAPPASPPTVTAASLTATAATSCAPSAAPTPSASATDPMAMMGEPPPPEAARAAAGTSPAPAASTTHRTKEQREAAREAREAREAARESARATTAKVDAPAPAGRKVESGSQEMAAAADALAKAQLEAALR